MLFGVHKQALLIPRERASRLSPALRPESKAAGPVAQAMVAALGALPLGMRRSVTFDNGTELHGITSCTRWGRRRSSATCLVGKGEWRTR